MRFLRPTVVGRPRSPLEGPAKPARWPVERISESASRGSISSVSISTNGAAAAARHA
jgi:hypothetical protein